MTGRTRGRWFYETDENGEQMPTIRPVTGEPLELFEDERMEQLLAEQYRASRKGREVS